MRIHPIVATVVIAGYAAIGGSASARPGVEVWPGIRVEGASPGQVRLVRWAAARYVQAGIGAPRVDIAFAPDMAACDGGYGRAGNGHVAICGSGPINVMTRRIVLHEMGHIWLDEHISPLVRERFLDLRELRTWNDPAVPWRLRGYEQGAEILSWELGARILTAQIPDNDPASLARAYEVLTGAPAPAENVGA